MRVDAILIPAAAPAAFAATQPSSSMPSSFGAKLVSVQNQNISQKQSAVAAKSDSNSGSNTGPNRRANSIPSLNSANTIPKSDAKSTLKFDVKPANNPAPVAPALSPQPTPMQPTPLLAGAPFLAVFEQWASSAPAPKPDVSSTNPQSAQQMNSASVNAPPPPTPQPVAMPVQVAPASSPPRQPDQTATSANPMSATSRSAAFFVPNLSGDLAVAADNSGAANIPANSLVAIEASPKSSEPAPAIEHANVQSSSPVLAAKLFTTPAQLSDSLPFVSTPPATALTKPEPSPESNRWSDLTVVSSPGNSSPAAPGNPAASILSLSSSAPSPTPAPASFLSDSTPALFTEPAKAKLPGDPSSTDSNAGNSTPRIFRPDNFSPISSAAAQPAAIRGSATPNTAPAPVLSGDVSAAAAQSASAPETAFAAANDLANSVTSNLVNNVFSNNAPSVALNHTSNPEPPAQAPAAMATITGDIPGNPKSGVFGRSTQSASVAPPPTDKKQPTAASANVTPVTATSASATSSTGTSLPGVPAALAAGRDSSATVTPPAPPASAPSPSGPVLPHELPQTHQMLDSAPLAPPTPPPAPIAPGSAAELQMNAQMHVGLRTDAFGAVEIHTVVQQSQIGITVHADRDVARWFSSEIPSLESGLNKNHLNLTAVDFDHGRSGVQTATSFQHGQSRQSFSQTPNSASASASAALANAASSQADAAPPSGSFDILPSDLSAGSTPGHVSIHA